MRELAVRAKVPVMPSTGALPTDMAETQEMANAVGYPVKVKASWGGGGLGMRLIDTADDLVGTLDVARREALVAFGNDEVYLEKHIHRARHFEIQMFGDSLGDNVHLFERACAVQGRSPKTLERAPEPSIGEESGTRLCDAVLRLAQVANYTHAGTVEFLVDADTDQRYFIEANPRICARSEPRDVSY